MSGPTGGPGARIVPFGAVRPRAPTPTDDGALADILRRCAGGDPGGVAELSAWQGGRIPRTYARLVKDPELAEAGLAAALGVLARDAGSYDPARGPAEDWVFGRLRRLALEPSTPAPAKPPPQPVRLRQPPPERTSPQREAAPPEPLPARAEALVPLRAPLPLEEGTPSPDLRLRRPPRLAPKALTAASEEGYEADRAAAEVPSQETLARGPTLRRRPSALRTSREGQAADDAPVSREERPRRPLRRFMFTLFLLGIVGATAWAGLRHAGPEWNVRSVLPAALVDLVTAYFPGVSGRSPDQPAPLLVERTPDPPPPAQDPTASNGRAAIGGPVSAPPTSRPSPTTTAPPAANLVPPTVVAPRQQPAPSVAAPPPAVRPEAGPGASASAGGGGIRVFIHHTAADRTGAALAAQLADQLRREGYPTVVTRQVRFRVTAPGVRYFFAADREAAGRLLRTSTRFVAPRAGQAPAAPGDFTHVQPKPRAGTLEVWIPSR